MMQLRNVPKTKKLVVIGDGLFAEVAYECFTHDSEYEVVGFAVEQQHLTKDRLFGLPVVAIELMADRFPPVTHEVYTAVAYNKLNRLRARLMQLAEHRGYRLASYISSQAFVWPNVKLGKHCFIFEHNVVQPFVTIGNNVVLWSGNHIGHHTRIGNHVFISSHVVISGACAVGDYCFIGVNTSIANDIAIAEDCFLNLATVVTESLEGNHMYRGNPAVAYRSAARDFLKVED